MEVLVSQKTKLSTSMTLSQFENGYWYATQLKDFAEGCRLAVALATDVEA